MRFTRPCWPGWLPIEKALIDRLIAGLRSVESGLLVALLGVMIGRRHPTPGSDVPGSD